MKKSRNEYRASRRQHSLISQCVSDAFEQLETRRLMSYGPITPSYPLITVQNSTSQGITYTYNSSTSDGFFATSTPVSVRYSSTTFPDTISNGMLTINFNVDPNGNIIPGQTGPNLILSGTATNPLTHTVDYSGVLLEGNIANFGWSSTPPTANFYFDFSIGANDTGSMESLFAGHDIGATVLSGGTFTGSFTQNFTGGVNGQIGTIPKVQKASPGIDTTPNVTSVALGTSTVTLDDTADLVGANSPTGTITYTLFYNNGSTPIDTEVVNVTQNGAYTTPTGYTLPASAAATGLYQWDASYSGDTNNNAISETGNVNEQVTVTAASPTINTVAGNSVTLGSNAALTDTAVLSGGYYPTGMITFNLKDSNGNTLDTEAVAVNGNGTYSTPNGYVPTAAGNYLWVASYSGDENNIGATDNGQNETATISPVNPTISTQAAGNVIVGSGAIMTDTAVLSGGYNPTGMITFTLTDSQGHTVDQEQVTATGDGAYVTPIGYIPVAPGSYLWSASYSGDSNNNPASDNGVNETETVSPASPAISTIANGTVIIGSGVPLMDNAYLSGGDSPTGTITFTLYDSANMQVYSDKVIATGDGNYNTSTGTNPGGYIPLATGSYLWVATYSGDSNNNSATDDGVKESEAVAPTTPSFFTSSNPASVTLDANGAPTLTDTATINGYQTTGMITFSLYYNNTLVDSEQVNVNGNGNYTTPTGYTLPTMGGVTGVYQWDASYSGDSNNNPASETNSFFEQTDVSPAAPAINTQASETAGGIVGVSQLSDVATLSGGYYPTGTITFTLTQPDQTTIPEGSFPVSGDGNYASPSVLATEVGNYTWHASYSGDTNNGAATDNGANEGVTTTQATPAINTSQQPATGIVGTSIADQATVSGGDNPTGTVTFNLYSSATVQNSSTLLFTNTETLSGGIATSVGYTASATGTDYWVATYNGDTDNASVTSGPTDEPVSVTPASPAITTQASETSNVVGSAQLSDLATLSGGFNPGGTIAFTLTQPDNSTISEGSVAVSGDGAYSSPSVLATQAGNYTWHATYSGDTNNTGASDNGANEGVATIKASPAINTVGSETGGGVVGVAMLSDSATLSGGYNVAGGTITFSVTAPDGTTSPVGSSPVTGDGSYSSPSIFATEVGTYTFHASYSGNGLNLSANDNGINESVTTVQSSPAITTQASESNGGIVGSSQLRDVATLSGGDSPTGMITFTLTTPNGSVLPEGSVAVGGDGAYTSPTVLATQVGNYTWHATYSGDTNNIGASDNGANEGVTTTKSGPAINTQASETSGGVVGSSQLSDVATLSGGYMPGGSISFSLTAPDGTTTPEGSDNVTGDGAYNSPSVLATEVGAYTWHATYSGDTNNVGASDNGANEGVTTIKSGPAINTQATESNGGIVGSSILTDKATLSGGFNPSGTITFTLTQPDNTTITVGTVNVSGDAIYSSPSVTATEVGNYTWHAIYSGDSNNASASDNGANEGVTTIKSSPAISTQATESNGGIVGNTTLCDAATITGGYNVGGSVTFTLTAPDGSTSTIGTVNVSGDGTFKSPMVSATEVGTYTWHATYSGNSLNNGALDNGTNESVTTAKSSPAIATQASETASGVVGSAILSDAATITGGYNVGGTIAFSLTAPDGTTSTIGTVNVSGDSTYNSPAVTASEVGTYTWHATYSGDSLNTGAIDNGTNESVTTVKANSAIATKAAETNSGVVGSAVLSDTATISGGYHISSGAITFSITAPDGKTTTVGTVNVTGAGAYNSPTVTATEVGTYTWHASYNGDGLNNGAVDNGVNESVTSVKSSPSIVTTASFKSGCGTLAGSAIMSDAATLSGGYNVSGGTITFSLTAPDGTTSTVGSVNVTADGIYTSPSVTATEYGTYTWHATYNGNGTNNTAVDNGKNESLSTTFSGSISGTKFNDVTGNGFSSDDTPLSGVTIDLYSGSNTSKVIASAVTDSNGNYSFTSLAAGAYVVEEVVPTGWVQTAPVSGEYTITVNSSNPASTGNNFDDFMSSCCNTSNFTCVSFCIQDACGVKTVSDLRGNTNQGDEVTANFDYTGTSPHPVTFVTYTAPDNYWNPNDASEQQIFQSVTIMAQPGWNSITVQIPNCDYQIDLVCGYAIDQLGPAGSNITYSSQSRLISADNDGCEAQTNCFGQVNGTVYLDLDNDGKQDSNETGIAGVTVLLTGKDQNGDAVSMLRITDSNGDYSFQGLQAGTYSVKEITPAGYVDGKDTLGTGAGGTASNDLFSNLKVVCGTDGENYNFGELPGKACSGVSGCTATCTFWNGTNGQKLICSFGSGSSDCTLGNWLASCYPNLYGSSCGTNCLAGKTNSQVCSYFQTLYKTSSCKTQCEVLAACLNVYTTDASLGGLCGAAYGFSVQCDGAACDTYSVGSNGSCFGVSNNTKCSISQLLSACNSKSSKGSLFGGNTTNSNSCYTVLSGINGW